MVAFSLFNPIEQVFWECNVAVHGVGDGELPILRVPLKMAALHTEVTLGRFRHLFLACEKAGRAFLNYSLFFFKLLLRFLRMGWR